MSANEKQGILSITETAGPGSNVVTDPDADRVAIPVPAADLDEDEDEEEPVNAWQNIEFTEEEEAALDAVWEERIQEEELRNQQQATQSEVKE